MISNMLLFSLDSLFYFLFAQIPETFITLLLIIGLSNVKIKLNRLVVLGLLLSSYTHVIDIIFLDSNISKIILFILYIIFIKYVSENILPCKNYIFSLLKSLFIMLSIELIYSIPLLLILNREWETLNLFGIGINLTSIVVTLPVRIVEVVIIIFIFRRNNYEFFKQGSRFFKEQVKDTKC